MAGYWHRNQAPPLASRDGFDAPIPITRACVVGRSALPQYELAVKQQLSEPA
jgi:hypothetical protein